MRTIPRCVICLERIRLLIIRPSQSTCFYDGDTGELNNEVVGICTLQLDPARDTYLRIRSSFRAELTFYNSDNGACFTGCPARMVT